MKQSRSLINTRILLTLFLDKSKTSVIPNEAHKDIKNLTLQVMGKNMNGVNIRLDESVLDVLDRVFIVNENNEPYMVYKVADLRAAREQFGLAPDELILVGSPDDEVMKGTEHNGEFVSVEPAADEKTEEKTEENEDKTVNEATGDVVPEETKNKAENSAGEENAETK